MALVAERLEDQHKEHEDHDDGRGRAAGRITAPSWSFVIFVVFV
jgi:hypothetical protein